MHRGKKLNWATVETALIAAGHTKRYAGTLAREWRNHGFTPCSALLWIESDGVTDPDDALYEEDMGNTAGDL